MKFYYQLLFVLLCCLTNDVNAQNARVQVIHNAPDTSLRYVDVYWNGVILYNNFVFHRASTFLNRPGNAPAVISIADSSSTSVNDAFATFNFTPAPSQTYVLVLQGIRNSSGYASYEPFDLKVIDGAREYGLDYATVDMMFVNGSPDDVTLKVDETFLMQVPFVESLAYGESTPYMSMFTGNYVFQLQDAELQTSLGDYNAPFGQYGLNGRAVTIFTSGFSNPSVNSNGPLLSMWMSRAEGGMMTEFTSYETTLCLLHNSPEIDLDTVDVYWSGQRILDDFVYASTSPLVKKRFTNAAVELAFAPSSSESVADALATIPFQPALQDTVLMMLSGVMENQPGYQELELIEYDKALLTQSTSESQVVNGIVDLPIVTLASDVINNLESIEYGELNEIPWLSNIDQVTLKNALATYDLGKWQWVTGSTVAPLLIASGYNHHPMDGGRALALYAWNGVGAEWLPLDQPIFEPCTVRLLNSSVETNLGALDVYINEELVMSEMEFEATPIYPLTAELDVELAICRTGESISDALVRRTYQFIPHTHTHFMIDGFVDANGYNPAPLFDLREAEVYPSAGLGDEEMGLAFYQGASDVGSLAIDRMDNNMLLFGAQSFGEGVAHEVDFNLTEDLPIAVRNSVSNFDFGSYVLPVISENLNGSSVLIFSRGFWNPQHNNNGEGFGMWIMKEDGSILPLEHYVAPIAVEELKHSSLQLYPNPSSEWVHVMNNGHQVNTPSEYQVFDAVGNQVMSGKWQGRLDVNVLSQGVYCLLINGQSVQFIKD
jgi:hypothetical protein